MAISIQPIKIAFITDSYWPSVGGNENAVRTLSSQLPEYIHCKIVTHSPSTNNQTLFHTFVGRSTKTRVDPHGHTILYLNIPIVKKLFLLPLLLWNIRGFRHFRSPLMYDLLYFWYRFAFFDILKSKLVEFDIIHSISTSYCARLVTEICTIHKKPLVHSPPIHFKHWGDSPAQLSSYLSGKTLVCPTEHFKKTFLSMAPKKSKPASIRVIPPMFSIYQPSDSAHSPIDCPFMLFLGRRETHKGLILLLKAFEMLDTPTKLVIAGPGEKTTTLNSNIIDLGIVSEQKKADLLYHCEFLVVPTSNESFGIVFTEAMSFGKPVIALDIPPVNEIVQNGISGILVSPGNVIALYQAIERLLSDPKQKIRMGVAARNRYDTCYNPSLTILGITQIYEELIQEMRLKV